MEVIPPPNSCALLQRIRSKKITSDILFYYCDLATLEPFLDQGAVKKVISSDEWDRAGHISNTHARTQFIAGRIFMRILLADHLNISPQEIKIHLSDYGKPYQKTNQLLYFNLSHSQDQFALVVSSTSEVGVDIEYQKGRRNLNAMAEEVLAANELSIYSTLHDEEKLTYFYKLWSLKEATLKAYGSGLSIPANSIGFSQHLQPVIWNDLLGSLPLWTWWHWFEGRWSCAIAVRSLRHA